MRTVQNTVYRIDELSEKAQEHAWQEYLVSCFEMAWSRENRQSLEAFCEVFPVTAKDWEYGGQCASITPVMDYSWYGEAVWKLSGLRLRAWLSNSFGEYLFAGKYYGKLVGSHPNRRHVKRYSKAIVDRAPCPFTGYCMDNVLLDPIHTFIEKPDSRTLADLLNECLWSWIHACQADYEEQSSLEYFIDTAEANDWEFTWSGDWA